MSCSHRPIVGKGYLKDDDQTAASFIPPPDWYLRFNEQRGTESRKLYKSGDLVRYAENGSLLIQRRKETSQQKIRGQRIELKEIQFHLDASAQIKHSIIVMPACGLLQGKLVAVISLVVYPQGSNNPKTQTLKLVQRTQVDPELSVAVARSIETVAGALEKQLPRYMIPEIWLVVEKVPVQMSHKLDRQRVLQWVEAIGREDLDIAIDLQRRDGVEYMCGSEVEETIRRIWAQVLDIQPHQISLEQSFFRLGGDSLDGEFCLQRKLLSC